MNHFLTALLLTVAVSALGYYWYSHQSPELGPLPVSVPLGREPRNFIECAMHYEVRGAQPRTCTSPIGVVHAEYVGNAADVQNRISLASPAPNELVSSPLAVQGRASGRWFKEEDGTFAVELRDSSGKVIASAKATTAKYWETDNFIAYAASLSFAAQRPNSVGLLVLSPGEGSGEPLTVPVIFR